MVTRFKRSESEDALDARIAVLSARRSVAVEAVAAPAPVSVPEVEPAIGSPVEDRLLVAKEQLIARLNAEVRPERRSLLSRSELAKVVDAAVQAYLVRHGMEANPLDRRDLVTSIIETLLNPGKSESTSDGSGPRRSHRAAIDAAKAAGVSRIVYTSHVNPVAGNPIGPIAEENRETEAMLQGSATAWTVLRFGSFAELQVQPATLAVTAGRLITNAGDGRVVPVSRRDCAEAAAIVLTTDGHDAQTYEITGPTALSQRELAAVFAEVSGRTVKVVRVGDRMLEWGLVRYGTPKPVARAVVAFGRSLREGYFDVVDPAFERLSGRPPLSLREVLIPHRRDLLEAA